MIPAGEPREQLDARDQASPDPLDVAFEEWWEREGQYHRAGGTEYAKTFAYHAWHAAHARSDAKRASYWKQRALSAEGALPADTENAGARALHARSKMGETVSFEQLTDQQRWGLGFAAHCVVTAVNGERLRRLPHDHPEKQR